MTLFVDNSILESVAKCTTQACMRYVHHWSDPSGMVMANTGKAVHEALAEYFKNWNSVTAIQVFEKSYQRLLGDASQGLEPKDPCQLVNVRDILEQYFLRHPQAYFPFEPLVEGIEKVHSFPLVDDVVFFGLVDLPARDKRSGALHVVDHKTRHGYINEWWTKKFRLTSQFTGYVWVLQKLYEEIVPAVYVNAIAIQKLPDPVKTKCRVHKVPYEECRLQHASAQLFITSRSAVALERWESQAISLARRFKSLRKMFGDVETLQYAPDEGRFNGSCVFCDFKSWCKADRAPSLIEGMFVQDRWAPWDEIGVAMP